VVMITAKAARIVARSAAISSPISVVMRAL
jgi:hypothetical protein